MKSTLLSAIAMIALLGAPALAEPAPATQQATTTPASRPSVIYPANSPEAIKLLTDIQTRLQGIESVQADFVQEKSLKILKHTLTIRGRFAMAKPDRVIWVVNSPVHYAIRVFGDEVRQWDEDTNKVQVLNLAGDPTFEAISEQIQGWFLGDYGKLKDGYDVAVIGVQPLALRFSAKSDSMVAKLISAIDVTFNKEETNIARIVLYESEGNTTTLTFSNSVINQPIKAQAWEIPPK